MKVLYLASGNDILNYEGLVYQDKFIERDLGGCMLEVDLEGYDIVLASPPCNYWSRANYRRETSKYSQDTKHLLPDILDKLRKLGKPYIVENVRNEPLFKKYDILDKADYVYYYGRHTYFTNVNINDLIKLVKLPDQENIQNKTGKDRQGGNDITELFNSFIKKIQNERE